MMGWGGPAKGKGNGAPSNFRPDRNSSHDKPPSIRYAKAEARKERLAALEEIMWMIASNPKGRDVDRIKAAEALANRIDGMPVARNINTNVDVAPARNWDLAHLSNAQLEQLSQLLGVEVAEPPALPSPLVIDEDKSGA